MLAVGRDYPPVTPHLTVTNAAAAMTFYRNAFDAVERRCLPGREGGVSHAEITINRGLIVLSDVAQRARRRWRRRCRARGCRCRFG